MKKTLATIALASLGFLGAQAQTKDSLVIKKDTTTYEMISKDSIGMTKYFLNNKKQLSRVEHYIVKTEGLKSNVYMDSEKTFGYDDKGRINVEFEGEYSMKESRPLEDVREKIPKNIEYRNETRFFLDLGTTKQYKYDDKGRKIETETIVADSRKYLPEKSKTYFYYIGEDKNPSKIWYDNDNDGVWSKGDKKEILNSEKNEVVSTINFEEVKK